MNVCVCVCIVLVLNEVLGCIHPVKVCYIPGLLGPGPNVSLNPLMNPNMQLGLIILLALQMQGQRQQLVCVNLIGILWYLWIL